MGIGWFSQKKKKKKKQGKINKDVQNWGPVADGFVGWWLNLDVEI
jgi:hypothetical protein